MERIYIAKIAILALLRHVELINSAFDVQEFLSEIGLSDFEKYQLYDKVYIDDVEIFTSKLYQGIDTDSSFFLKLGMEGLVSQIGSYSFFLQNSPSFRDLLHKSSQFIHIISNIIGKLSLEDVDDKVKFSYHFSRQAHKLSESWRRRILESNFGTFTQFYNKMATPLDRSLEFHSAFTHELSDEEISAYLDNKFISASDGNYVLIPKRLIDAKNLKFEEDLPFTVSHGLTKHLEAQNVGSLVLIISNLLEVKPSSSLADISEQLHISKRTLQRRLQDQDINFTSLKQSVSNQKSLELLDKGELSVEEISKMLGYSSTATFVHAFTKWQGLSPAAYKKNKRL